MGKPQGVRRSSSNSMGPVGATVAKFGFSTLRLALHSLKVVFSYEFYYNYSLGSRLLTVTVLERQEGGAVKRDAVLTRAIFLYNK